MRSRPGLFRVLLDEWEGELLDMARLGMVAGLWNDHFYLL